MRKSVERIAKNNFTHIAKYRREFTDQKWDLKQNFTPYIRLPQKHTITPYIRKKNQIKHLFLTNKYIIVIKKTEY